MLFNKKIYYFLVLIAIFAEGCTIKHMHLANKKSSPFECLEKYSFEDYAKFDDSCSCKTDSNIQNIEFDEEYNNFGKCCLNHGGVSNTFTLDGRAICNDGKISSTCHI